MGRTASRSVRPSRSERTRHLPGDDFIPDPIATLTHAITVNREPPDVWPWIAQMGAGRRAGWYSYDVLDNGRQHSATRIVPEWQPLTVGMVFPALPGATDAFTLLAFDAPRSLILGWVLPDDSRGMTWAFVLEEADGGRTRLIVRVRGGSGYRFHGLPWWLVKPFVVMVHFIMQRKQLHGIAGRAERWPPSSVRR